MIDRAEFAIWCGWCALVVAIMLAIASHYGILA